jgi:hypothetical protein
MLLSEYMALEEEERRETGQEYKVIHPHPPHVPKGFPLRVSRSAGVALLQEYRVSAPS